MTALWIIAIPLMDMIAIMYRRLRKDEPPSPDRQHIHHLIMRAGFTPRQAFVLITTAAALLAAVGVIGERLTFYPRVGYVGIILACFLPVRLLHQARRRVARYIKRIKRRLRRSNDNKQVS